MVNHSDFPLIIVNADCYWMGYKDWNRCHLVENQEEFDKWIEIVQNPIIVRDKDAISYARYWRIKWEL